ncbi:MAG: TonB-dependent receptor [Prevotella sp.]|nr:TonB-dependent receptor [Prevotella sp.]
MKNKTKIVFLLMTFSTFGAQAQTDSTTVKNDSVTWSQTLDGVTVKAQRQLIKQEIDRVGYDVQADEDARTENVLDMLRKVPMVTIDGEDNILVKGNSNYKIYKNGHLDPSMTKNTKEILKAMPANSVKRIEVITDPGAREDAESVNAILNIVMMDGSVMDGITGSVTGAYSTLKAPRLSTYLTTQMGKAIVSVNYGYNHMSKHSTSSDGYIERTFVESGNTEKATFDGKNPGYIHYANINASYDIDTFNLLSASFGGYFYKIDVQGNNSQAMLDATGTPLYSFDNSYWLPSYNHHSWNGRMDYEHRTRRKGELFTLSYMLALTRQNSTQENNYSNMQNVPFDYTGFLSSTREHFTEHTFQADYVRPLWTGHKLEVGTKYIDRRNSSANTQTYYKVAESPAIPYEFDHTTQIAAAYADYMYNYGRWSARAGLRYEYSYMKGHYPLEGAPSDFSKHLNDWVPQASVKYQIDSHRSLKLGYTTSINRPGITYLNPATIYTPNRVDFGNAHLVSSSNKSISLTYMYVSQRLTLQIVPQYHFCNDALGSVVYAQNDIRYGTYDNVIRQRRLQMEAYAQWKPFDGTTFVANINYRHAVQKNLDMNLELTCDPTNYYFYIGQKLPWKLFATAYTYGQMGHAQESIYAYSHSWNRYAFSLQRSFLREDRLTVRLMANSPFHKKQHTKTRTVQGDITGWGDNTNNASGRFFQFSLSYRFGKLKASVKKTETTIENSDVVGGITKGNN